MAGSSQHMYMCTMLKVGMKVLSDNNCELLVLDKVIKNRAAED
jgi:hypothetical protein